MTARAAHEGWLARQRMDLHGAVAEPLNAMASAATPEPIFNKAGYVRMDMHMFDGTSEPRSAVRGRFSWSRLVAVRSSRARAVWPPTVARPHFVSGGRYRAAPAT